MFTIQSATNLYWTSPDNDRFDCDVKFAEFAEPLPFACNVNDPVAHAQELWSRAMRGDFGAIAPYVEPVQPEATEPQPEVGGAQTL